MLVQQEEVYYESRWFVAWRIDGWQPSYPQQLPGISPQMAMDQKGIYQIPENLDHNHRLKFIHIRWSQPMDWKTPEVKFAVDTPEPSLGGNINFLNS